MGTFSASLKTLGDRRGLPATISLEDDVLSITAGDQEIGTWNLKEITLEPVAAGYRMGAEGEQIIIELPDKEAFAEELNKHNSKARLRLGRKEKAQAKTEARSKTASEPERPHTPPSYQVPVAPPPAHGEPTPRRTRRTDPSPRPARLAEARAPSGQLGTKPAKPEKPPKEDKPSLTERIDGLLDASEKRWGALMPSWFFTRLMFWVVVGAFVLMLVFPGAVSTFLLATGMLLVIVGAIVYTDDVLASKWLPGRMTPTHVLMFGVAILMFGVLLGVIAR